MKLSLRAIALAATTLSLSACGGNGGFLNTSYNPSGNITVVNSATGDAIVSSTGNPFVLGQPSLTVYATEGYFNGPYTAKIISWNNGFNEPCFVAHAVGSVSGKNVGNEFTISADNAPAPGAGTATNNPCVANTDEETLQILDGKGNSANIAFVYST